MVRLHFTLVPVTTRVGIFFSFFQGKNLVSVNHLEPCYFESDIKRGAPTGRQREAEFKHLNPEF